MSCSKALNDASEDLARRRRRAIWRAGHRGMKELDLTLGRFAASEVPSMSESELAAFEALIDQNEDNDLYHWLIGDVPVPTGHDTEILRKWLSAARAAASDEA